MKNNRNKKSFTKLSKRNTHKRTLKERAKAELLRAVMETGVNADGVKLHAALDKGRRGRVSGRAFRDEIVARGVFSSSKSGFGFVTPTDVTEERDIFIPEDKVCGAIEGDTVEVVYHKYKTYTGEEKTEGRIRKIIEYGRKTLIGTAELENAFARGKRYASRRMILIPDDHKISVRPMITDTLRVFEGDKLEVLLNRGGNSRIPECTVLRNFGNSYTKEANYDAILAECGIDTEFSKEVLAEADFFAAMPVSDEGRVDRRGDIIFTIDGEGAKDLDDAISLKRLKGGSYQLGVHIADVSYYVRERTHLDRTAMARGTSVYFTDKVVPMLPRSLSNGACSLGAGEDKYVLSAIINLSADGDILLCRLEPSVIRSRVRGVYSEVNKIFDGTADKEIKNKYKGIIPTLEKMRELYRILAKRSAARGALELETSDAEIILANDGTPCDIIKRERGDAEKLIEQFMLCANEAVATLLTEKGIPCVYRVHENPPPEKLSEFLSYLHNLGFDTSKISRERSSSADFSALLREADARGILRPVSYSMLRAMAKAKYSDIRHLHFGLGIELYCHFTSPIRRLSDLATHRIIHKVLFENKRPELYSGYARRAAAASTEAELRALNAERRIENLYKVIYMEQFIGMEFDAIINSVTSFGFFAELENTCEGLVPISELPGVFTFDEKNMNLRSRDITYKLGDTVRVRLEECDIIRGKLRFSVALRGVA